MSPHLDLDRIRGYFPALADGFAFLENAGGSQMPIHVIDRINTYVREQYVQTGAGYGKSERATKTVADALHYAHCATGDGDEPLGIVHRDLSPANIFISDVGEIKLGDFGVAHVGGGEAAGTGRTIAGKDHYMAPEQIRRDKVTPATDLFALGSVLYELLTNEHAFDAESVKALQKKIV